MKLLSIIIPVYNVEKYLDECLNSITIQNKESIEIILINDGSTDNSLSICNRYVKKYNNIKCITNKNHGVSYSRNLGITIATGKYIWFIDSDDKLETKALDDVLNLITSNYDLYIFSYIKFYKNTFDSFFQQEKLLTKKEAIRDLMEENKFCGYVWNKLFKKDIIKKYNLKFDENIAMNEDMKFCFDYIRNCNKIICAKDIIYDYRCRKSSTMNKKIGQTAASSIACYKYIIDNSSDIYVKQRAKEYYLKSYYKYRRYIDKSCFEQSLIKEILTKDYINFSLSEKLKIYMYKYIPFLRTIILAASSIKKKPFK